MIYYIADTHFGHEKIRVNCERPFETVEEMDRAMVENWNSRVKAKDTVYIVGDMFFRNERPAGEILSVLKGHKMLVLGNHDHTWLTDELAEKYFDKISHMEMIHDGDNRITLCHYPMMTWYKEHKGAYLVYGHIHNSTDYDFWPLLLEKENMFNAGVEINGYTPVTLEELIANNRAYLSRFLTSET